ncbi:MAG: YitT family protein [Bacteroidales bacterium]|nr:YitT family protein [Bacteroidales bacterium]MBR2478201.1 YitT family protein [Bacteroidales bacterium]
MNNRLGNVLAEVKAYVIITFGLLLYTLGWIVFLIPNNMVGGGVTGISAILLYAFNIPVSASFFVINLVLLLIALKVLGKAFGAKTVYAIIIASIFYEVVPPLIPDVFIQEIAISNGKLLCAIFGGVCAGLGIGISFSQGGSTGGTDIVALMIVKYRNVSAGRVILLLDIFIIASSLLLPPNEVVDASGAVVGVESWGERFATILYGYILIGACSYSVDMFISGTKQSLQIFIFSKKYAELADAITSQTGRGVTLIDGEGWYTKQKSKVVMVIMRKDDMSFLYRMIREIDKDAFLSVASVSGVYGKGFDEIKK